MARVQAKSQEGKIRLSVAARRLNRTPETLLAWSKQGKAPRLVQINRLWYFVATEFEAFVNRLVAEMKGVSA